MTIAQDQLRIDMIHHNPGDQPFDTAFSAPAHLKGYGYNGQAFKHINTIATLNAIAPGVFPGNQEEADWLDGFTAEREREISDAKTEGLQVYYHIDLFVLPTRIVEHFKEEILDPQTGRIDINRVKTLEIHRALFDEILSRYPEIDGFIVRVGETYLFDTPFHTGDGAIHYHPDRPVEDKVADFITLLEFLREEVCVKHGKTLLHRTWDTWPNRFHASREFYLSVTDAIDPHPKLIFSIKHTAFDFHRWVPFNPCLTHGKHPQIIEVQCQREYEGKGAYPNYAVKGVIDGFSEPGSEQGLRSIMEHSLIRGIYTWSRGGGWFGPLVTRENELWCDLNAFVICQYAEDPRRSEEEIFNQYCFEKLNMNAEDKAVFRSIAVDSLDAVVKGKCCTAWDRNPDNRITYPTNQWMRDDVLHGYDRLGVVFDYLTQSGETDEALLEKRECIGLWQEMRAVCDTFSNSMDGHLKELITTSVEYGLRFFSFTSAAWHLLARARSNPDSPELDDLIDRCENAWAQYQTLSDDWPLAASLYRPVGWHWPDKPETPGLATDISMIKNTVGARSSSSTIGLEHT